MRILGIAGSIRRGSHNRRLLRAAGDALPSGTMSRKASGTISRTRSRTAASGDLVVAGVRITLEFDVFDP